MTNSSKPFNLEERTLLFSKTLINTCHKLPRNNINQRLVDQLIRSGTSIGANYREANETDTKKDFKHRIRIAKKEAKETTYWLELLIDSNIQAQKTLNSLHAESLELMKILGSIYEKSR